MKAKPNPRRSESDEFSGDVPHQLFPDGSFTAGRLSEAWMDGMFLGLHTKPWISSRSAALVWPVLQRPEADAPSQVLLTALVFALGHEQKLKLLKTLRPAELPCTKLWAGSVCWLHWELIGKHSEVTGTQ